MKRLATPSLAVLLLGAFALSPSLAATPEPSTGKPGMDYSAPAAKSSKTIERLSPDKAKEICARYDMDKDGSLSSTEFVATLKTGEDFKTADANRDGRLDMKECSKVIGSS